MADKVTHDMSTGIGTFSFPHVFPDTVAKKDDGTPSYEIQIIIPKTQRDDIRALLAGIKKVGEARWGDNWRKARNPLRDGDAEADDLTEDGSTKGEKYPERKGCFFLNARSTKPVAVVDAQRVPITNSGDIYGGAKGKIAISFYPYSSNGNNGIGVGLNGVQKIADGESFGSARPSVESMFDMLDESEIEEFSDVDLGDEDQPKADKKAKGKKGKAKAKDAEDDLYADLD